MQELESGISGWSQVSVINRMRLSFMLWAAICNLSSSILSARDLVFLRNRLGSGALSGCLCRQANAPGLQPCFCLLSLPTFVSSWAGMVIHREPGCRAVSTEILRNVLLKC